MLSGPDGNLNTKLKLHGPVLSLSQSLVFIIKHDDGHLINNLCAEGSSWNSMIHYKSLINVWADDNPNKD